MAPRLTLETLSLLRAMLTEPDRPFYGLELSREAALKTGTIYPALARLEKAGWLQSVWELADPTETKRPRRRLYRLTGQGEAAAREALRCHAAKLTPPPTTRRRAPGVEPGAQTA